MITKILFIAIFQFTISFLDLCFLKIPTLIRNAELHSFSPFYLNCLFEFSLRKTVEKCVDFVDYLVIWHEVTTTEMFLEVWKQPKIAQGEIWRVLWMRWQFNIDVFEVFLHQSHNMRTYIILVRDLPLLQFPMLPINMSLDDYQDVIFLVDSCLCGTKCW